jgi:hypothetical protein
MTEEQLRALLRLKRYEVPPPDYFDGLLRDIHRRQRTELLRRPLWKIALERVQTFFGEHSMSPASYAGAMATLLILGISAIGVMGSYNGPGGSTVIPDGDDKSLVIPAQVPSRILDIQPRWVRESAREQLAASWDSPQRASSSGPDLRQPRYIIDARPVSYEPTFSF